VAAPAKTARIVEWNLPKGYGFLENNGSRLFLHIREFIDRDRLPRVGDMVSFRVGYDREGRVCAVDASFTEKLSGGELGFGFGALLGFLLLLPAYALLRYAPDLKYALAYLLGISTITWFSYVFDKKRAQTGGWRVPEIQLHILEFLGGWPAAFLAQRYIRHKTKKKSYRLTFWFIVLLHQYIALDSLLNWQLTTKALTALTETIGR
jgi:uncharacterized membrane protein YsdA (DUF1294 family)/cold shock CspA family protein